MKIRESYNVKSFRKETIIWMQQKGLVTRMHWRAPQSQSANGVSIGRDKSTIQWLKVAMDVGHGE